MSVLYLVFLVSLVSSDPGSHSTSQGQDEELYNQLQSLEQMISLVRNARSVTEDLEEAEDDQEIMEVMSRVDLSDSTNVDAVGDILKTLSGSKQMEFLMTKIMMGRADDEDLHLQQSLDVEHSSSPDTDQAEEDEPEPLLSRQRRFISDMFSYFTGDQEPEPEEDYPYYSYSETEYEPSYPSKSEPSYHHGHHGGHQSHHGHQGQQGNQNDHHRHHRSPYPQPEPEAPSGPYSYLLHQSGRDFGYDDYLDQDEGQHHHHQLKRRSLDELPKKKPFIHLDP